MSYSVKVIFGKEEILKYENDDKFSTDEILCNVKEYRFQTESEMRAFLQGMEAVVGWTEYLIINQGEEL